MNSLPARVIFLDFDGVIRVRVDGGWAEPGYSFCSTRIYRVSSLAKKAQAMVVISSDWRNYHKRSRLCELISPIDSYLHDDWRTATGPSRQWEIERWLNNHPEVEHYVILDDQARLFNDPPPSQLVLCSNQYGFVEELYQLALQHLNGVSDQPDDTAY